MVRKKKVIVEQETVVEDVPVVSKSTRGRAVKRTQYFIANNHTGDIVFPRSGRGALKSIPLTLPAGRSIVVDAEEWNQLKNNKSVLNYIEAGLISEVMKEGEVAVMSSSTGDLPIPPHLQREEEIGKQLPDVRATVRRKTVSRINV